MKYMVPEIPRNLLWIRKSDATQHGNKTFESNLKKENDDDDECNENNDYNCIYLLEHGLLEYTDVKIQNHA